MEPADLLLGRKTYKNFAGYWPAHAAGWPGINEVTKYVLSKTMKKVTWSNTVILRSVADIRKLKKAKGGDIKVWGSSKLVQLLLKHDLVDELWLKIYPILLGKGKKPYNSTITTAAFTLTESTVTSTGVIIANYRRAGKVKSGIIGS
jgi:dihydrofolate reductase